MDLASLGSAAVAGLAFACGAMALPRLAIDRRDGSARWFGALAVTVAAAAAVDALRYQSGDAHAHDLAVRCLSAAGSLYAAGFLCLYLALSGRPIGHRIATVDAVLLALHAVAVAWSAVSPGGLVLDQVTGVAPLDLGWAGTTWGTLAVSDPIMPAWRILGVATVIRCVVIAWPARHVSAVHPWWLIPPCALVLSHAWAISNCSGGVFGVILGDYAALAALLLLGVECYRREQRSIRERTELAEGVLQRELLLSILHDGEAGFAFLFAAGREVAFANRAAAALVGSTPGQLRGCPIARLAWPGGDTALAARLGQAVESAFAGSPDRFLGRLASPLGEMREIDVTASPARDGQVVRYAVVEGRDVTDLRRTEDRLRSGSRLETIGQFAGSIAHDLRNLLTAAIVATELAQNRAPASEVRKPLAMTRSALERIAALTRRMLEYSRSDRSRLRLVRLADVVAEAVAFFAYAQAGGIEVHQDLRADPDRVLGDPVELGSALLNLLVNARDAMPAGGRVEIATFRVELDAAACARLPQAVSPGPYVVLEVADDGPGMPAEVLARIFEPFFTTKAEGNGTGLGLAAVMGAVRAHAGAISAASTPGSGTRFLLYLPLHLPD